MKTIVEEIKGKIPLGTPIPKPGPTSSSNAGEFDEERVH
jgi:hypothetical protein